MLFGIAHRRPAAGRPQTEGDDRADFEVSRPEPCRPVGGSGRRRNRCRYAGRIGRGAKPSKRIPSNSASAVEVEHRIEIGSEVRTQGLCRLRPARLRCEAWDNYADARRSWWNGVRGSGFCDWRRYHSPLPALYAGKRPGGEGTPQCDRRGILLTVPVDFGLSSNISSNRIKVVDYIVIRHSDNSVAKLAKHTAIFPHPESRFVFVTRPIQFDN